MLPLLYLHGLSTGDFGPALEQFLGFGAGLSAASITRLTGQWTDEARAFAGRDLSGTDYVCLWVDGIHTTVRLEQEKLCLLVMIGVRTDGRKELVAISDGFRESHESWADLLRDCRRRGMRAPVLAVGDGALGFWKAVREVFPETREQRCWWHRSRKVSTCCSVDQCIFRHPPAAHESHQGTRLPRGRNRHGLQADRGRPIPLAQGQPVRTGLRTQFRMSLRRQMTEQARLSGAWWMSARRS